MRMKPIPENPDQLAFRIKNFAVRSEKSPYTIGEFTISVTHNGNAWVGLTLYQREIPAIIAELKKHL